MIKEWRIATFEEEKRGFWIIMICLNSKKHDSLVLKLSRVTRIFFLMKLETYLLIHVLRIVLPKNRRT